MAQKFQTVKLQNLESGDVATGEFVVETTTAWQVAVKGKVRLFMKNEWTSLRSDEGDVFGGLFGHGFF